MAAQRSAQTQATAVSSPPAAARADAAGRRVVVEACGLTKRYGNDTAVAALDLTLYEGEIFGLLGPNGAGKTTTVLMLLGLTEPTAGTVQVLGENPARNPLAVKAQVGYLPENIGFYDDMTGFENLLYTAELNGMEPEAARNRIRQLLEAVGLEAAAHRPVRIYSRGMRQRLGLADVLVKQPRLVILDEPTLGIDPAGIREILQVIARLAQEEKVTVLLSSHLLHQVQQICHRVGILVGGRLIAHGTLDELSRQLAGSAPAVIEAEVEGEPDRAIAALRELDGVVEMERDGERIVLRCNRDLRPDAARALVTSGLSLKSLQLRTYALDDIYHTYFEGGKTGGTSSANVLAGARS